MNVVINITRSEALHNLIFKATEGVQFRLGLRAFNTKYDISMTWFKHLIKLICLHVVAKLYLLVDLNVYALDKNRFFLEDGGGNFFFRRDYS